jgi:hypothetical protein
LLSDERLPPLADLPKEAEAPIPVPYAYRSFDRQFCLPDNRLGDFLRPVLWRTLGARQLYMTSLLTGLLGRGPAATVTALVPDLDHFRGSFGAKHVIPLWRDPDGTVANVADGVLARVGEALSREVVPEELFAYCYALLSAPEYCESFADELEVPGPRIPITGDSAQFARSVAAGERLIWLHTYGARFVPPGHRAGEIPQGRARSTEPVGSTPDEYPERHGYDDGTERLLVGGGVFEPVSPAVRGFSVSGLDVIGSWLDYRMRGGAGRRSSPLDAVRVNVWPAAFTEELLRLLWIVEHTVDMAPELNEILAGVAAGPVIPAVDLPKPSDGERAAPARGF